MKPNINLSNTIQVATRVDLSFLQTLVKYQAEMITQLRRGPIATNVRCYWTLRRKFWRKDWRILWTVTYPKNLNKLADIPKDFTKSPILKQLKS